MRCPRPLAPTRGDRPRPLGSLGGGGGIRIHDGPKWPINGFRDTARFAAIPPWQAVCAASEAAACQSGGQLRARRCVPLAPYTTGISDGPQSAGGPSGMNRVTSPAGSSACRASGRPPCLGPRLARRRTRPTKGFDRSTVIVRSLSASRAPVTRPLGRLLAVTRAVAPKDSTTELATHGIGGHQAEGCRL
jgi:hypothetical protein